MNRIDFSDVGILLQADALEGLRACPIIAFMYASPLRPITDCGTTAWKDKWGWKALFPHT